jgi:creatinine amidohydrolase
MSLIHHDNKDYNHVLHYTSEEIAKLDRATPILLPMGCIEAHGHHLPLDVDLSIAERMAKEVSKKTGALVLPTINYVYTGSTKNYPGAFGVSIRTTTDTIKDIVKDTFRQGFYKIMFLNANGANMVSVQMAVRELLDEFEDKGLQLAFTSWWDHDIYMKHADATETEMYIAACGKEAIRWDRMVSGNISYPKGHRTNDWSRWSPHTAGVHGDPTKANIENAVKIFERAVDAISKLVEELKAAPQIKEA